MPATRIGEDVERLRGDAGDLSRELPQLARQASARAREVLDEQVERWRGRGEEYAEVAGEGLENARVYVVERVQERPLTATFAALGVGFLIGALLAGSRR